MPQNNIANVRKSKGLTQRQLAERLGIHITNLNRIERGKSVPDLARLDQIATVLEVPVSDLITESPREGDIEAALSLLPREDQEELRGLFEDIIHARLKKRLETKNDRGDDS